MNEGAVAPELAAEFPDLRLWWTEVGVGAVRSPPEVRQRLKDMSDRFRGAQAVALRAQPVPHAYRVFFRHIGLDPDSVRVPIEELAVERLRVGRFRSRSLLHDAITIAMVETSVPVYAVDGDTLSGELQIRAAIEHEPLDRHDQLTVWLPAGRLVVADDAGPVGVLLRDTARSHDVTAATRRSVVFSIQVPGVPGIHVEEALWSVVDLVS